MLTVCLQFNNALALFLVVGRRTFFWKVAVFPMYNYASVYRFILALYTLAGSSIARVVWTFQIRFYLPQRTLLYGLLESAFLWCH